MSASRVTGLSIYVKRLGHPEIRQKALEIMQAKPSYLSSCAAFLSLAGFQVKQPDIQKIEQEKSARTHKTDNTAQDKR